MPVVAVVNRKGGSGKTTLATHLAAWCATTARPVMIGDVDYQGSAQAWLRRRSAHKLPRSLPIVGWSADPRNVLRPPAGVTHVVLDTPGGLRGLDLAKVVMAADVILVPVCHSVFDRDSAADCYTELKALPRVASGRCKVAAIGMRLDARTRGEDVLRAWAEGLHLPFLGVLRETQSYVRCAEQGLTLFDLPAARVQADLDQWQPILDWLQPLLKAAPPVAAARPAAQRPKHEPGDYAVSRAAPLSTLSAQVPLDVLEGPQRRGSVLRRLATLLGLWPLRRSLSRNL